MKNNQAYFKPGDNWKLCSLDSLVYVDRESLSNGIDAEYSFYYIDINSVSGGKLKLPAQKITYKESPSRARRIVKFGDVLVSTVRPNLKAFVYFNYDGEDCIASTGFAVLTAKENTDAKFILYSILSENVTKQIESLVVGSNYPAINYSEIKNLQILSPPLPQQHKIAKILTTVDNVIEQTEAAIAKYQAIKQGMMHDLFTRGINPETGQLRPPFEYAPELYKETERGMVLREWEVEPLSNLASVRFSNVDKKSYSYEVPLKLCNYLDVYQNELITNQLDFMLATVSKDELVRFGLKNDDVIITKDSETPDDIAVPAWVSQEISDVVCGYHLALIRSNKSKLDGGFLSYLLQLDFYKKYFLSYANGSTRYGLSTESINNVPIVLPILKEQKSILLRILSISEKIEKEEYYLSKVVNIKQGLMQDLLTGKVQVKEEEIDN